MAVELRMEATFHGTTMATFSIVAGDYKIAGGEVKPSPEAADVLAAAVKVAALAAIAMAAQREKADAAQREKADAAQREKAGGLRQALLGEK